jgi:hypothetical protein
MVDRCVVLWTALLCISAVWAAEPASPRLSEDPRLQATVTVDAGPRSLSEILTGLSKQSGIRLVADKPIGNQRMMLQVSQTPLHAVMEHLRRVLSHDASGLPGYHWRQKDDAGDGGTTYQLWRDAASLRAEQVELDYPRRRIGQVLNSLREVARTDPARRDALGTDLPRSIWTFPERQDHLAALASLSTPEMDVLAAGRRVSINPAVLPGLAARHRQAEAQRREEAEALRAAALAMGKPDPLPQGPQPEQAFAPTLFWERPNVDGDEPWNHGRFTVRLERGAGSSGIGFDLYMMRRLNDYGSLPEQRVDLTRALRGPEVTREQFGDVGYTVRALARAAGLKVVMEHFYQPGRRGGLSRTGVPVTVGPVRELVRHICEHWDYRVERVGDTLYFWPYNWAMARACDIPERDLDEWRALLRKSGEFTVDERARMARAYSQGQLSYTMRVAIRQAGRWSARQTSALRLYGALTPTERSVAATPAGLPVERITARLRETTLREFLVGRTGTVPVLSAPLRIELLIQSFGGTQRQLLRARSGDRVLAAESLTVVLPLTQQPPGPQIGPVDID